MRGRRNRGRDVNGLLVLDKAPGLSSNAALQQVKRIFQANKAGHGGSLDPLATGVLPLCFGEATKVSQFLLDSDKQVPDAPETRSPHRHRRQRRQGNRSLRRLQRDPGPGGKVAGAISRANSNRCRRCIRR